MRDALTRRRTSPDRRAAVRSVAFVGAVLVVLGVTIAFPAPAYAAATITITPGSATVQSGQAATFTLTVSCSTTGGCADTTVSIPTTTVTGNGANTDFANWVGNSTCAGVTRTAGAGVVTFNYGTVPTGGLACNFTVTPPQYLTYNGAQLTITPTVAHTGFAGATAPTPATLSVTAGHNVTATMGRSTAVTVPGGSFSFNPTFNCGAVPNQLSGDIGTSSVSFSVVLPAGFTQTGLQQLPSGTPPGATLSYNPATRTVTYSDPTGATCSNPQYGATASGGPGGNVAIVVVNGTATTDGTTPTAAGANLCAAVTASVTYIDATFANLTSPQACVTVSSLVPTDFARKDAYTSSLYNGGQYSVAGFGTPTTPYTYPGNWDSSGNTTRFTIVLFSNGANAGADFAIQDPMPCLSTGVGGVYTSLAPGAPYCATPLFVPTTVTAGGFTPPAGTPLTLVHPDGSTSTVTYTSGVGWVIPTTLPVSQINMPRMATQGNNPAGGLTLEIGGYASAAAEALGPIVLRNTLTAQAFKVGEPGVIATDTATGSIIVQNSGAQGRAIINPMLTATYNGGTTCTAQVAFSFASQMPNSIEITTAPSREIRVDYLAPEAATVTSGLTTPMRLVMMQSRGAAYSAATAVPGARSYSAGTVTAVATPNFNGTGRTLYEWVIPARTALLPGDYVIQQNPLTVQLPAGCAGVYHNDITVGYGGATPITACINHAARVFNAPSAAVPTNPTANGDLASNGIGTSNYCGMSAPITVAAINPAFTVDKQVQGNLDAEPIGSGGIGSVSPTGGTATYTVSFANTGQANLDDPVMYDLLPRVGDTEATSTTSRQSQFPARLVSLGALPAGVSVQYSTATNPCRPEVLASNPGCVSDWSSSPPVPLSQTTALRFAYDGTVYVAGNPGTTGFSIPYTVSVPDTSVGNVAWNSVGTTVYSGASALATAESSYTGLQATQAQPLIVKSSTTQNYDEAGDTVSYTFQVTNNTAVTLSGVTVTDAITDAAPGASPPAVTCQSRTSPAASCSGASTTLAPGQVGIFVATYTVRQADIDYGRITDRATVRANPPTGGALTNVSNSVTVPALQTPALTLQKRGTLISVDTVGQTISWDFTVTNNGNTTVSNLAVNELAFSGSAMTAIQCPRTTVASGASVTCTASSTVTQADLDAGTITNTADASGVGPGGQLVTSAPSTATITATQNPALTVSKSASPSTVTAAGQAVTFRFLLTNTGNTTLTGVQPLEESFSGTNPLGAIACPQETLAVGASIVCTADYTVSQDDIDNGEFRNTAQATATAPGNRTITSASSTATVAATQSPGLALSKTSTPTYVTTAGDTVTYEFTVRNSGNVTVTDVEVAEESFTGSGTVSPITCPETTLAPTASMTCTATYTVSQADIDRGTIENTASATGIDPTGVNLPPVSSSATVTVAQVPGLTIVKTATPTEVSAPGQVVQYTFDVGNNGNVTITDVRVEEVSFTGTGTTAGAGNLAQPDCPQTILAPNDTMTCGASYTVTQADIDNGTIVNVAVATGTDPGGEQTTSPTSSAAVTMVQAPALTLTKTADRAEVTGEGQTIDYTLRVANSGNVTITGVVVADQVFTGSAVPGQIECPQNDLAPGDSMDCTAAYNVTQQDVDQGSISNTAVASGSASSGDLVTSNTSTATVTAAQAPALTVVKSADPSTVDRGGQPITYRFLVTNTGNVTLTAIAAHEQAFTGTGALSEISCPMPSLAPDQQTTCVATYQVTQKDMDAGQIVNTGDATGIAPSGAIVTAAASEVTVTIDQAPELSLTKTADNVTVTAPGQSVTFRFHVVNSGNVTISDVDVVEGDFTGTGVVAPVGCTGTLLPGQAIDCIATYTSTQADIDGGRIENTATATGTDPNSGAVASEDSTAIVAVDQQPSLALVKQADRGTVTAVGQNIGYTFRVTNTGNTTLDGIEITEKAFSGTGPLSIACPATTLAPGAAVTCATTYAVTAADLRSTTIVNTAFASGIVALSLGGFIASDPSTVEVIVNAPQPPGLASTGIDAGPALFTAVALLAAGAALTVFRLLRRRRP